ncbi:MAG: carbohydrate kinase family protein [Patescibacteria group bacterium]
MFHKPIDLLSIGDITTDAFIRLKEADVHCRIDKNSCEICMPFGDKIPFEYAKVIKGVGNAANAAVASSRLGLESAIVSNIGSDQNGRECVSELIHNKVITSHIKKHHGKATNYHFVLWYGAERTILVNHVDYEYTLPKLPPVKWIYLTSLATHTFPYHMAIADYLEANPKTRLAFQPGTFQMQLGFDELKRVYDRTDIFVVNVEEAQKMLKTDSRDVKILMKKIHEQGPKLVLVTDGPKGAYMFDGEHHYFMPIYPDPKPPLERTGCGDAFASTFVSAILIGKSPLEALTWAPVNPMSVAQFVGAREGLLSHEQIEWWLKRAPSDYKVKEI